ncbi:4-hydroxyphenylpyruvate dioxygenase [Marinicella gelatinilytica]|uniref:4-hydroxyphenylpyruvate dioxygenase n=1 Tax=Marinicella gelatinilytica TaxID=2996017 RepID=UPI002260C2E2|nr:4-hydroxyphenylpyruvate dioxygenase [Marinicella gelatinilytica]MCX7544374.1 4-hydroxyphenylpyruvate dioxygenase [Marinicella gelatinilytica]
MSATINGFGFIEYSADNATALHRLFRQMGFNAIKTHKQKPITLYRQGQTDFFINECETGFAADFRAQHGPSAPGFSIIFDNKEAALEHSLKGGSEQIKVDNGLDFPAIKGIGDAALYLLDKASHEAVLARDFEDIPGVDQNPTGFGLTFIDHLTHNLYFGNMAKWSAYYEDLFDFREIRYFDIKGAKTGLVSKAMTSPNGSVKIPLNESNDPKSQINEYLDEYKGEGIQHIAMFTDNIYETIESMRAAGVEFLETPDTYYSIIDRRVPEHNEDVARMQKNHILIDADEETKKQLLLQIFTQTNIGPIFFEIIQRKGNEGFGEGNFQALFESIELEQQKRGYLDE